MGTKNVDILVIPELNSTAEWDASLKARPDYQFHITYDFYNKDNPEFHKFPLYGYHNGVY